MIRLRSRVGPKGQAVIPKPVRDQAGISPGDEIFFRIENGTIIMEKENGKAILNDLLSTPKRKRREPAHIDWDKRYAEQLRARRR